MRVLLALFVCVLALPVPAAAQNANDSQAVINQLQGILQQVQPNAATQSKTAAESSVMSDQQKIELLQKSGLKGALVGRAVEYTPRHLEDASPWTFLELQGYVAFAPGSNFRLIRSRETASVLQVHLPSLQPSQQALVIFYGETGSEAMTAFTRGDPPQETTTLTPSRRFSVPVLVHGDAGRAATAAFGLPSFGGPVPATWQPAPYVDVLAVSVQLVQ
jgi:hypothetical protein